MLSQTLRDAKVIDISQPLFTNCAGWYDYPPAVIEPYRTVKEHGFNAERIQMIDHTGTHLDTPYHFYDEGARIEQVPVERFQGEAVVLDLRHLSADAPIGVAELEPFAERIGSDAIVMFCTGWGEKRGRNDEFMYHWPYLTGDGARWLVERGVRAVAIDSVSIGGSTEATARPSHEVLLSAGCWILEDIRFPEELIAAGKCYLFSFPILFQGCGGAFVRAVAVIEKSK